MDGHEGLATGFEAHRDLLRGVAYRMLGSVDEADDAVQRAWLRADRADLADVRNLAAWLTTVTSRVCLDMLRTRKSRNEQPLTPTAESPAAEEAETEDQAVLAEEVGRALLVVLDRLSPAERVAFVLHDMFAVPFDEIAPVVGRTEGASKKLASRARHRVHGAAPPDKVDDQHYAVVDAFLAASRGGDMTALVTLLAPDVVRRADRFAVPAHVAAEVQGAEAVAEETKVFAARAWMADVTLIDGQPGIVVAPNGRLLVVLLPTVGRGRITEIDVIADPDRLAKMQLTVPLRQSR
jgi:RNA polymerase sigma-70 factor (ECF subfamily)